jgi:hypothetical protein
MKNTDSYLSNKILLNLQVFPDNGCLRQILSLKILCKRNSEGCEWTGPLCEAEV